MQVVQDVMVTFDAFAAQFPTNVSPQFGFTDFLGEYGSSGKPTLDDNNNASVNTDLDMEYNPVIGAVHARRLFVPHDQIVSGYSETGCLSGAPTLIWTILANTDTSIGPFQVGTPPYNYCRQICAEPGPADPGFTGVYGVGSSSRYLRATAQLPAYCQGFTALIYKFVAANQDEGAGTYASGFQTIRFRCTSGELVRWFSISFHDDSVAYIAYTDGDPESGPYQSIGDIKSSGTTVGFKGADNTTQNPYRDFYAVMAFGTAEPGYNDSVLQNNFLQPGTIPVEVLLMAGQVVVTIGGNDIPLTFPQANLDDLNTPLWALGTIEYLAQNYAWLEWSAHPTKFTVQPGLEGQTDMGFNPTDYQLTNLEFTVHYANDGGDVYSNVSTGFRPEDSYAAATLHDTVGTILYYDLVIYNTVAGSWTYYDSNQHEFVTQDYAACTCCIKAVTGSMPPVVYTGLSTPYIPYPYEEIDIDHEFSLSTLSIRSSARIMLDNAYGQWTNIGQTGWCDLNGTVAAMIDLGYIGGPYGRARQFSGLGNVAFNTEQGAGGETHVSIECMDMWRPLDVPQFAYPWFDNRNVYWVMSYLAAQGGCPQGRQQFYLDGYVPVNPYAPCPNGAPSYYLPSGPAGTPVTRFAAGEKIKDIMLKISNSIGFLLFFDVYGVMQFYKFQLPSLTPAGQYFRYYPTQGPGESLTEIWGGNYRSSLDELRNNVTVIGANYLSPAWNPLVFHATDTRSIMTPGPNYKGFSDPVVWADNIFAQEEFGQSAANAMLYYMSIPAKTATLTTWLQWDEPTYPLNVFYITDNRAGASAYPYLITRVTHRIRQDTPPTSTLEGRLFPSFQPGSGTPPP